MKLEEAQRKAHEVLSRATGREVRFDKVNDEEWRKYGGPHLLVLEDFILCSAIGKAPEDEIEYEAILFADSAYGGLVLATEETVYYEKDEVFVYRGFLINQGRGPMEGVTSMSYLYACAEWTPRFGCKPWRLYQLQLKKRGAVD